MEEEIVYIPKHKKFWLSITKFERYPEMATEGVGRAIGYLAWLVFMFSVILAVAFMIKFMGLARKGIDFIDKNCNEIIYSEGVLNVDNIYATTDFGNVIVNTEELTEEQIKELENKKTLTNVEIICLREFVIIKQHDEQMVKIYYNDIFDNLEIKEFNKSTIVNYLNKQFSGPKIYISFIIVISIGLFISFLLKTLLDVLVLSLFGMITTLFAKIQIRYRAIFNMSVYAITLSTVLQLIYIIINTFTGFNVKYFDLMYTAISFICLTASIFMIKSDVIRQQIELMKVIEQNKQEMEKQKEEKKEEQEEKEEKKEKKDDEEKKEETPPTVEGET